LPNGLNLQKDSKKLSLYDTVGGTIMSNEQQHDDIFTRSEIPHDVSARSIAVPENDQNKGVFVDEDDAPFITALLEDTWNEVLNSSDFYDESDYLYGGAHFPPTIER
jgi:hypothetical protein